MCFSDVLQHLIAEVEEGRAEQGVIPIENDHRLMLRGLLRLSGTCQCIQNNVEMSS